MTLTDGLDYFVAEFYNNQQAREYVKSRGLGKSTVEDLMIGYCPDNCDASLAKYANRIIFPIFDISSEVIAFGGRLIAGDGPKYYNSPGSNIYEKSKVLYNLNAAQDYILTSGYAIVVEGYMDVAVLWENGIRNVVATCGTAFTRHHIRTLKRYADSVALVFDGDEAGHKAAASASLGLREEQFPMYAISLPGGKDPDEFVREYGVMDLIGLITDAKENNKKQSRVR
jgi:DNA primase